MTSKPLATILIGLSLAAVSACGASVRDASDAASPTASSGLDREAVCESVTQARKTALDRLNPILVVLSEANLPARRIAKATDDVKSALTELHVTVSTAINNTGDPQLKDKLTAYQVAVENAIVAAEGTDGDKAKLVAAIKAPEMQNAEQTLIATCPSRPRQNSGMSG